jgi:predicted  nucleic acid-binding Zn-ribbon protein
MTRIRLSLLMAIMAVLGSSALTAAQDTIKQEPPAKSRVKPSVKPAAGPLDKADDKTSQPPESDQAMQRAITSLSTQIGLLNDEVRKLRRETARNSEMMELLLNEDRLAKLEDKIQEAADHKAQLDAREQELVRRSRNIQGELVLRGGLRRDEAEAAIRSDIQRALDDVHSQQAAYQQRAAELVEQSTRVRARVETLRKKFELSEEKNPQEKD